MNISKNVLRSRGKLFAVRVVGDSMNSASVPTINNMTSSIEDGDFAIVDTSYLTVDQTISKYVVSVINGLANIKKLAKRTYDYALLSESKDMSAYPPIIIHEDDDYLINGRVVTVIKV